MKPLPPLESLHPREAAAIRREWAVYERRNAKARDAYAGRNPRGPLPRVVSLRDTVDRRYRGLLDEEATDG